MSQQELEIRLAEMASGIRDSVTAFLDYLGEKHATGEPSKDVHKYDGLFWEAKEGQRGKFEQTSKSANNNSTLWQDLKAWLEKNNGKAQLGEHFTWQFSTDPNVVGRKKTK